MDRFLIAPLDEGLRTDLKPWQIPDQSFAELNNAYIFRGRLKKRIGSNYTGTGSGATAQLNSRLRINLGTTNGSGALSGTAPGAIFKVGQQFSVGSEIFAVNVLGTPGNLMTTSAGTGTFNTTTGAYVFTGCALTTAVYFYPAEPVMGLTQYEVGTIHNQTAYAFDTQFIYKFSGGSWIRDGSVVLTSADYNFIWAYNWEGVVAKDTALFITNFKSADGMYYLSNNTGTPTWSAKWTPQFITSTAGLNSILTARIIIPFKNRLLLLNTVETDNTASPNTKTYTFTNRCRYSQNGSPIDASANAFMEPNQASWLGGGFIDAPIEEDIISAELIRDRCVVYFERSTWEIAYTGNEAIPFIFQQLNSELGTEAQFSAVPFDKFILNVGSVGIQSCNSVNVDRIDDKIPDAVFDIRIKNQGMQRVAGVRDYYTEMVYWTFPTDDNTWCQTYPNKVLVYNYKNGTWAMNDDCITCFGYWEQQTDQTWADMQTTWLQTNQSWTSNVSASNFRFVIAGNQQGYVTTLERDEAAQIGSLSVTDAVYSSITNMVTLTVIDHCLAVGDFIRLDNFKGSSLDGIYKIYNITDVNTIIIDDITVNPGTYTGGGTIARVPRIEILSKEWNPYKDKSRGFNLSRIEFGVERTENGQMTIDYFPSHSGVSLLDDADTSGSSLGSGILETSPYALIPLEAQQDLLWHSVYFSAEGDSVQIMIYQSDDQLCDQAIAESDFTLEGLILYCQPTRVL